jgi:hypothetical protein
MLSPSSIRSTLVTKLKQIPTLVALLGSSSKILEYIEQKRGDYFKAVVNLNPDQLLVSCQGFGPAGGQRELYRYSFEIAMRPDQDPFPIALAIIDGIPSSESLSLCHVRLFPSLLPMDMPVLERRLIVVAEDSTFSYWQLTTGFVENS